MVQGLEQAGGKADDDSYQGKQQGITAKYQPADRQRRASPSSALLHNEGLHRIIQLQRTLGNHRVTQLIESGRLTPRGELIGLHPKLAVGAAHDRYEQEADRVAQDVLSMPEAPAVVLMQDRERKKDKDAEVQPQPVGASNTFVTERQPAQCYKNVREPIQAASAGALAESFEAGEAFTHGSDIYYGSGVSPSDLALTAHELTHVAQQTGPTATLLPDTRTVQRQEVSDGTVVFPPDKITAPDPNVVQIPEDKVSAKDVDQETQQVMQNIAAARTRAMGYLEGTKTEVMMAVDTFKGYAAGEIDAMDLDPSAALDLVPIVAGAVGGAIAAAFPPAAAAVILANLAIGAGKSSATAHMKEEAAALKLGLKASVHNLSEAIKNAQSAAIIKLNEQIPSKLNELAATDKGVWDLLKVGNDRNLDTAVAMLGIRDPHQNSPHGNVLKAMMVAFGSWMGKAKYQHGMKGSEKLISESVPHSELHKGLRDAQAAAEREALEKARKMAEEHQSGPSSK